MKITDLKPGDIFWMSDCQEGAVWIMGENDYFTLLSDGKPVGSYNMYAPNYLNRKVKLMNRKLTLRAGLGDNFIDNSLTDKVWKNTLNPPFKLS